MSNNRDFFRLEYPAADRPTIVVSGMTYEVLDLSEEGVKFAVPSSFKPNPALKIRGTITFKDGKSVDVVGTVLRILERKDKNQCVLTLTSGVPLPKMMEEQRYLLKKYRGME